MRPARLQRIPRSGPKASRVSRQDLPLRIGQVPRAACVQALVARSSVEALHASVLGRLARLKRNSQNIFDEIEQYAVHNDEQLKKLSCPENRLPIPDSRFQTDTDCHLVTGGNLRSIPESGGGRSGCMCLEALLHRASLHHASATLRLQELLLRDACLRR